MIKEMMKEHEDKLIQGQIFAQFKTDKEEVHSQITIQATGRMLDALIVELIFKRAVHKKQTAFQTMKEIAIAVNSHANNRRLK